MLDSIERALYWLSSFFFEGDADSLCQLRCPVDETTLLTNKDQLMSVIRVRGNRKLMGAPEFEKASGNVAAITAGLFKSGTGNLHSLAFAFRSSPEGSSRVLKEAFEPTLNTARRMGVQDFEGFESQITKLAGLCSEESSYMVFFSHPSGLSPAERTRIQEWRLATMEEYAKKAPGLRLDDELGQRPRMPAPMLMARHQSALANFLKSMQADIDANGAGLLIDVMPVGAGLGLLRRHLDATGFPTTWKPRLLGDAVTPAAWKRPNNAMHLMPLRIGRQLVPSKSIEVFSDVELVKRDGIYYGGLVMTVLPESGSEPFHALADRIGRAIPYSCSMELIPNGTVQRGVDRAFAGVVGAMGDYNKAVKGAWRHLKEMVRQGVYVGAMRMCFSTWAKSEREAVDNLAFLKSSLESWGSATVTNETGGPAVLALASAPGYTSRMPAAYLPGPLTELCRMLPLFRPESVWDAGQLITHTREGRPYPIAWGSVLQNYWGTAIFAPTGSGKSFLINMINEGILFSPGLENLPYIAMVDVGPSAKNVVLKAKAQLPERLARQILYLRLRNEAKYSVNPFDTQLGCDRPTPVDRDAVISVLSTIAPNLGQEGEKFLGFVVDEAYKQFGRKSPTQRRWQSSLNPELHQKVLSTGFQFQETTFVWEVVDGLMRAGHPEDALVAQRYAVPRMPDLVKACRSTEILNAYKNTPTTTLEGIIDVFSRAIQTAQNEYALVYDYTQFDVGNARAVFVDLEELVTGDDSMESKRRSAMMMMFGRRLATRNYFLRWDELESIVPPDYVEYHRDRVKDLEEQLKFLEFDEVHYANGVESMKRRIGQDLRVGRKYKIVVMLASQLLGDFSQEVVNNCFNFFILGVGTKTSLQEIIDTFGLSESEAAVLVNECTGPGRMLALFKTTRGDTSQSLRTAASGLTAWSFSTSKDDDLVRREVAELTGDYMRALKTLAKVFPSGSARDALDLFRKRRKSAVHEQGIVHDFVEATVVPALEKQRMRSASPQREEAEV